METIRTAENILSEIRNCFLQIPEEQLASVMAKIKAARRIFCVGAGRSGIILKAFCMRLNHIGFEAYLAGGIPCPPAGTGDLVIGVSGSGKTASTIAILERVKQAGSEIILFTAAPEAEVRQLTSCIVEIAAPASLIHTDTDSSAQPMRTLFEQTVFLVSEVLVAGLCKGIPAEKIARRHTNLE